MPIKFPKPFTRRRSSGNLLETFDDTSKSPTSPAGESSFRVLPRSNTDTNVFVTASTPNLKGRPVVNPTNRPNSQPILDRNHSQDEISSASHRGSGKTYSSVDTVNNRDSYASTDPSSLGSSREHLPSKHSNPRLPAIPPIPPPPMEYQASSPQEASRDRAFSFKAAGRTFSFGNPKSKPQSVLENAQPRERSATQSSYASTATPPKLDFGNDLSMGDKAFGNDFSDLLSKRKSTILEEPLSEARSNAAISTASKGKARQPYHADSVGSLNGHDEDESQRRLIGSPTLLKYNNAFTPAEINGSSQFMLDALNASRFLDREHAPSQSYTTHQTLRGNGDGPPPSRAFSRPAEPTASTGHTSLRRPVDGASLEAGSTRSFASGEDDNLFDTIRVPTQRHRSRSPLMPQATNKVMTPEEFEEYKARMAGAEPDEDARSDTSGSSLPDDEDETERNRSMAKQRRKQEAQLAVYRQQMMKVTGEQPSELPSNIPRPGLARASQSTPNFVNSSRSNSFLTSTLSKLDITRPTAEDDDEDDEVPLGVLQAHGFPNKNRPPTRMSAVPGAPSADLRSYPAPRGSTRNEAISGGGGSSTLPPFARNLPSDPYIGASLVQQPSREFLRSPSSTNLMPSASGIPPGGLIGVIAGEERARALRRGSPNTQGTYEQVPGLHQQYPPTMNYEQQVPPMQPYAPQQYSGGGAVPNQAAMNQSMTQMMQMQMQWMQQMMSVYNMQSGGQMPQMPPMPGMPPAAGSMMPPPAQNGMRQTSFGPQSLQRPGSSASAYGRNSFAQPSASSMFNFPMNGPGPGYTPSIAPSERSNVGQPSRYRPVSAAGDNQSQIGSQYGDGGQRSRSQSNLTITAVRPGSSHLAVPGSEQAKRTTIRAVNKPKHGNVVSDDEDEEGWAQMAKKREERKSKWRMTKSAQASSGAQEGGMEGLLYDG